MSAPKRSRSKNFEASEMTLLTELVEQKIHILNAKHSNNVTNEKKRVIWESIAQKVNALGVCHRSATELRNKWCNMHQDAKKQYSAQKISQKQTGGGPCRPPMNETVAKIVDLYKDCPSFNGLAGVESPVDNDEVVLSLTPGTMESLMTQEGNEDTSFSFTLSEEAGTIAVEKIPANSDCTAPTASQVQPVSSQVISASSQAKHPTSAKPKKRKIRNEDVTELQYEVLVEQKKKIKSQTLYYDLMNEKLKKELGYPITAPCEQ